MNFNDVTIDMVVQAYYRKAYRFLDGGNTSPYLMNVFGIRSKNPATNKFDDMMGVLTRDYGATQILQKSSGTTEPGFYWLENPENVHGTAILVPGQYLNSHTVGLHKGQYPALVQVGKMKFYRDSNKDDTYDCDPSTIEEGVIGCNVHHAAMDHTSTVIDKWSAACQVYANPDEHVGMMDMARIQFKTRPLFDYTLFLEEEVLV